MLLLRNLVSPMQASVFSGGLVYFLSATVLAWSSPVLPKLENITTTSFDQPITIIQGSWISSLVLLGATIGPFVFSVLSDVLGRKITILSLGIPFCLAHILMISVERVEAFYVARFMAGLTVGGAFSVFTMYMTEITDKKNRGSVMAILSCLVNLGFLLSYIVGSSLTVMNFNIILVVLPVGFLILFFLLGEETAHFWMLKNNEDKAVAVLRRMRPAEEDIEKELLEIKQKIKKQREGSVLSIMKSWTYIKSFLVAIGLLILQPFTGNYAILMYGQTIFEMAGAVLEPSICTIIMGLVQFLSSLTLPILADKFGRKTLLMASAAGMVVIEIPLGIYCYLNKNGTDTSSWSFFPILALALFMLSYNNGFGPMPLMISAEIFPARVKSLTFSVICTINWGMSFLITKYFTIFVDSIGLGVAFWFFGCCSGLALFFVYFFVMETKGKTLEEIQDDLKN